MSHLLVSISSLPNTIYNPLNPLHFSSLLFSIRMDSARNKRSPTSPSYFLPLRSATQSFLDENKESVTVSESAPHSQTESLQPRPLECLHEPRVPPFLCKTYDIVDDPLLDGVISWAPAGNSFVVWNPPQFERAVLPTHFKHANFSSFVRQLNTYGFRKTSADRWEFANEDFLRGSKHLLKNINRRRSQGGPQTDYNSLEIIKQPHVEAEVQNLRRDRNKLVEEVSRLRQDQVITLQHMDSLNDKMESAEQRQKQMVSFMAKIMENPAFTAHLKNHQQHRIQRKILKLHRSNLSQSNSLQQQEQKQQSEEKEMKVEVQPNVEEALYPDTPILSLPELEMHASTSAQRLKGKNVINDVSSDLPTAHYMIADEAWCNLNNDPTQLEFIEPCWDMDLQLDGFEDLGLFNVDL